MKNLYIILILSTFLVSCLGTKKTIDNNSVTKEKEKIEISKDTSKTEKVNRAIDDEFLLSLRTNDSITNDAIRKALENFKQEKRSGNNSSSLYFDYEKMALILRNYVGETKDSDTKTNSDTNKETSKDELVTQYIETVIKKIPWWLWVVGAFFLLPQVMKIFTMIANPLMTGLTILTKKR